MEEVIRGDRVLHNTEVGRALQEMLALSTGILCAYLLAVNALHGETLFRVRTGLAVHRVHQATYLVFLLCAELNKRGMDIIKGRRRET